jgi:hypothetical protein
MKPSSSSLEYGSIEASNCPFADTSEVYQQSNVEVRPKQLQATWAGGI